MQQQLENCILIPEILKCSYFIHFLFPSDKPENVQLKTSAADNKAYKGETISINCSADAVPSVTSYQLLENGRAILDRSTGRWRKILTTGVFIYQCVAKNILGTGASASVAVTVNGKENHNNFLQILQSSWPLV